MRSFRCFFCRIRKGIKRAAGWETALSPLHHQLLREDLFLNHQVILDMPHELLQRVDAVGADIGADEHVHERIAHLAAPLVQPGAHIVDAGPGERLGLGGGQTLAS